MQKFTYFTAIALLSAGCANTAKQVTCADKNWDQVGYETAAAGKSVRTFDAYKTQCNETLGDREKKSYVDGFTRGIIEYCNYDNGYVVGSTGKTSPDVCPVELRSAFNRGYNVGKLEFNEKMRRMDAMTEQAERSENAEREIMRDQGARGSDGK